jgi:ribonucleotide reductase beta subunit family protein with ferritin-like domain
MIDLNNVEYDVGKLKKDKNIELQEKIDKIFNDLYNAESRELKEENEYLFSYYNRLREKRNKTTKLKLVI